MGAYVQIIFRERFERENGVHLADSVLIPLTGEFEYTTGHSAGRILPYMPVIFKKGEKFIKKIVEPMSGIWVNAIRLPQPAPNGSWQDYARLKQSVQYLEQAVKTNAPDAVIAHFVDDILLFDMENGAAEAEKLQCAAYIDGHFSEELSLSLLAERFGYSKQALITKFKKHFAMTPVEYITDVRMKNAQKLLQNTQKTVGEIAFLCGYENAYYFSSVFKKHIGVSPQCFRQQLRL